MTIPETLSDLRVPVGSLKHYGKNPRTGDVDAIAESLEVNGQYRPVVVNVRTNEVLAGNHTLKAARKLGWDEIAATYVDVDDEQAARIVLVDNRSNDLAEYDDRALADLLQEVEDLAGTGFSDQDLADLLDKVTDLPPGLTDPDDAPDVPVEPTSKPGDVWLLGPHRVVCGDSTDVGVVASVLAGSSIDVTFTDPPYGMAYGGGRGKKQFGTIEGDADSGVLLVDLITGALNAAAGSRKDGGALYVCFTWRTYTEFEEALRLAGMAPKACIVWDKKHFGLGQSHYRPQHEFVFYIEGEWRGDRAQSDVWSLSRDSSADYNHPTQKPVELIERALANSSKAGDIVLDSFGGSGSTLIAAHRTGRIARLVELDPRYVDVICRRYQEHTGDKPVLESTGDAHDFTV